MPDKPKRLGRGLDAILDSLGSPTESESDVLSLDPNVIKPNPFQPRKDFDSEKTVQAFEDLNQGDVSLGDCFVEPVFLEEVLILRVTHKG